MPPPLATAILAARGRGDPLPAALRTRLEIGLNAPLDGVRIHDGPVADELARAIGAAAFTVGSDIFFAGGRYVPAERSGLRLLVHEIAHTLQPAPVTATEGSLDLVCEEAAEAEADRLSDAELPAAEQPAADENPVLAVGRMAAEQAMQGDGPAPAEEAALGQTRARTGPRADGRVIRRYPDPNRQSYTPAMAAALSEADLLAALGDLRRALGSAGPEATTTPGLYANLDVLLGQIRQRHLAVGENEPPAFATRPDQLAAPGQTAALDVHYEAIDALAQRQLGTQAATLRARIAQRRGWLAALHRDAVVAEGSRIEALEVALGAWRQTKQITPDRPTADARIAGAEANLRRSLAFAAETLLSSAQGDGTVVLELARTDYLSQFARLLLLTAHDLKAQLRQPQLRDIPMVSNYAEGINTRTPNGPWEGGDDLREYRSSLERLTAALDQHGDLQARATAGPAERLAYLVEHGDELMNQVGQVQALLVAGQGIALVSYFQNATSSQLMYNDWARINDMRNEIIEPMISALRAERAPAPEVLESAQFHFEAASPEPTNDKGEPDPVAIADQQRRFRERRANRGQQGDEPEDATRRRLRQIAEFERRFGIFVGIVASIIGAVAAAGAVGAVMRTAVFSEGGALAAGQGFRIGVIRFVVQSLTFTFASQTMQAALYGRLPAAGDVAKAAAMDAATLGFMHAIGLPFTRIGQQPPTAVQFGALWAWSSAWQLGGLAWRGQLTVRSAAQAVALSGLETALMLKALEVAHRIGMLPTPDGLGNWFRPRTAEQSAALQRYLASQREGRAIGADAAAWQRSGREPAALDRILERSQAFMGGYRRALDAMRTSGLLAEAEIGPIISQAQAQAGEIRNLRDAIRLGLAASGPNLVRYTGSAANLDVYLQRLRAQGLIRSVEPVGRGGVYTVTYADGTVRHFYPQAAGPTGAVPAADLLLESVQRALPTAAPAAQLLVLESLHRLPAGAAARLATLAETSPAAATVLGFVARPEVAVELSRPNSLYSEQLLSAALTGEAPALNLLGRPERPIALQTWYQTEFEALDPRAGRTVPAFLAFLEQLRLYRGPIDAPNLGTARQVTRDLAAASPVGYFRPMVAQQTPTATIDVPGRVRRPPSAPPPSPTDFFLRQGLDSAMQRFVIEGLEFYLTTDGTGRPQRVWVFARDTDRPAAEIDLAGSLHRLREGVARLDALAPGQDAQARVLIDQLAQQARALSFLRRMRGFDMAADLALLDRIELDPRGSRPRPTPPQVNLPGPLAPPTVGPGAIFEPVTPSEILSSRQRALQARAARMGLLDDAAVRTGLSTQIRPPLTHNEQAAVRTGLENAERRLDALAESAYTTVSGRMGPRRFAAVLAAVFGGRTRLQVGEALRYMSEQPGYTDTTLDALAQLPPAARAVLGRLEPALLKALGEIAATSPQAAARLLSQQGGLLVELQRDPGMASRFVELAHLLTGGRLPFADLHRHLFGGILYPEFLVRMMGESTLVPGNVRRRLEALETAQNRLLDAGDAVAANLPPGHPQTTAYIEAWNAAHPLVVRYGEVLAESIRNSNTPVDLPVLEQQVTLALTRAFTLPIETAVHGPQGDVFFELFNALSAAAPRGRAAPAAVALAASQRLAYVELRSGLYRQLRTQLGTMGLVGPDGQPLPDVRIIITVPRGRLNPVEIEQELAALGPLRSKVVGIDLSGQESSPLPAADVLATNASIARLNFGALQGMFTANPSLRTEVATRLGHDPVETGEHLSAEIAAARAPVAGAPHPAAELARLNRAVQELVSELDARDHVTRLPDTLLGVTIHAGEQVRSDARIDMLLADIERALDSGVDRIGHGIVLGYPLPYGLAQIGFTQQPGGNWSRPGPGGVAETYTPGQLFMMERHRLALIRRIGDEGVTLEITPTSNIVLAGMFPGNHPLAQLLQTRPNLRVTVSTDNPGLHLTDPARELAIASAVSGATHAQMVRIYLEGFSSRLGARGIGNAATVREQAANALVAATPAAQRSAVLLELQNRYGIDAGLTTSAAPMSAADFAARLAPYLERAIR